MRSGAREPKIVELDTAVVCLFICLVERRKVVLTSVVHVGIATIDVDIVWIQLTISRTYCIGD